METQMKLTFLAVFAIVCIYGASAQTNTTAAAPKGKSSIKCFQCTTFKKEQQCDNPEEGVTPADFCEEGENMCRKVEQHITLEGDEIVRTTRSCAKSGELGKCLERTGTAKFKSWYCQCEGNLCNSAVTTSVSFGVLASLISFLFLL